jgi:hypothetical protein
MAPGPKVIRFIVVGSIRRGYIAISRCVRGCRSKIEFTSLGQHLNGGRTPFDSANEFESARVKYIARGTYQGTLCAKSRPGLMASSKLALEFPLLAEIIQFPNSRAPPTTATFVNPPRDISGRPLGISS